jgi:hypothetical protein
MKVAKVSIIAAAVLAVATVAYAQKPDFSGSWTPDVAADAAGGGGGRGRGMAGPMSVKQTADTLTVERSMGDNKITQTYKLDGSESKNQMPGGQGATVEATSTAKWDGAALVITTKRPGRDGAMQESTAKWSLAGDVLTIENTSARGTNKTTYKKST